MSNPVSTAIPLPPTVRQFIYATGPQAGQPLNGGTVNYYFPGGTIPKTTYQDYLATIVNPNPITLPPTGQWPVWGQGRYREQVFDALGNLQWDLETAVLANQPYEVGFFSLGTPGVSQVILTWNFVQTVNFATNFSGAVGSVGTNPSSATSFDIKLNGVVIGEMVVSAGGVVTFTTANPSPQFAAGSQMIIASQGGGANGAANLQATFLGTVQQ